MLVILIITCFGSSLAVWIFWIQFWDIEVTAKNRIDFGYK